MKSLLDFPAVYLTLQTAFGAKRARKRCIDEFAFPVAGERVLDVGCGPGFVIDYLPKVDYVGFDIDRRYIDYAKRRYGDRGDFHCMELTADRAANLGTFDLVLLNGVLHHLDDATALDLLSILASCLKPSGRVMTLDGCFFDSMSPISRFLLKQDRGQYVRRRDEYTSLASGIFSDVAATHRVDLFYIPYDALVMVCKNPVQTNLHRV
jgi:SAM-dependent methyltransferase